MIEKINLVKRKVGTVFVFTGRVGYILYRFRGFSYDIKGWVLQTKKGRNICINFVADIQTKKKKRNFFQAL
jgi:hypothetical protein